MADAYLGEIRLFAGNYAPYGWMICDGSLLPIVQYSVLYSIIGIQYGGDGKTNFALPNLLGRAPMHQGSGPGLTDRQVGKVVGAATVMLGINQMPAHTHTAVAIDKASGLSDSTNNYWGETAGVGRPPVQGPVYASTINTSMSPMALSPTGGNQPHNNMQPYLPMTFIICCSGEYPPKP